MVEAKRCVLKEARLHGSMRLPLIHASRRRSPFPSFPHGSEMGSLTIVLAIALGSHLTKLGWQGRTSARPPVATVFVELIAGSTLVEWRGGLGASCPRLSRQVRPTHLAPRSFRMRLNEPCWVEVWAI